MKKLTSPTADQTVTAEPTAADMRDRLTAAEAAHASRREEWAVLNNRAEAIGREIEELQTRLGAYENTAARKASGRQLSPDEAAILNTTSPTELERGIADRAKALAELHAQVATAQAAVSAAETDLDTIREEALPVFEAEAARHSETLTSLQDEQRTLQAEAAGCHDVNRALAIRTRLSRLPMELVAAELAHIDAKSLALPLRALKARIEARHFREQLAAMQDEKRRLEDRIGATSRQWGSVNERSGNASYELTRLEKRRAELCGQWDQLAAAGG
jgi:chromosome segregation ATPase